VLDAVDGPVVLCGHSYGGMVISRAASGRDDVDRLVYLCAIQVADDAEMSATMRPTSLMEHLVHGDDGSLSVDLEHAAADFYHDCEADVVAASVANLRPMPTGVGPVAPADRDVPPAAWMQMPSTYIVCTDDRAVHPDSQRDMAEHADDVVVWDTSHSPMLSRPELVADLLAALAAQYEGVR
jgi:pimeloyl-ACP methyl ester carboxylesterase